MESLEEWKRFLNKDVRIIINDAPDPYPKHKDGILVGITNTHLILKQENKDVALLLTDIRRVEIRYQNGK